MEQKATEFSGKVSIYKICLYTIEMTLIWKTYSIA